MSNENQHFARKLRREFLIFYKEKFRNTSR